MIAASRHWLRGFALWLALAVVLTCALGSFGSPVEASSGSAFNAFTSDVSLGPSRASEPEKGRKAQTPGTTGAGQARLVHVASALAPRAPIGPILYFDPPSVLPTQATAGALGARGPPRH